MLKFTINRSTQLWILVAEALDISTLLMLAIDQDHRDKRSFLQSLPIKNWSILY
jgi:hypothetical protein